MRALAGDVGGTKTRLGIFAGGALLAQEDFLSCDYGGLAQIAKVFLTRHPEEVSIACFGIAGPVINERVETVNLPWAVERQAISAALGLDAIVLINDLEATGWGLLSLPPESFVQIKDGDSAAGNVALIAAGTGLGEAGLFYNGTEHRVFASEGGHVTFAPENELQVALRLNRRYSFHWWRFQQYRQRAEASACRHQTQRRSGTLGSQYRLRYSRQHLYIGHPSR